MVDVRNLNIVQQHIGYAEQIRKRLFLNSVNTVIQLLLSGSVRHLFGELPQPRGNEATCTASKVCHFFTKLWLYHLRHKLRNGSRRVKLAGGTGGLQLPQNLLIDKTESMAFLDIIKLNLINDINHLTEINAVFHIVVGILKGGFHDCFLNRRIRCNLDSLIDNLLALFYIVAFQHGKQGIIDKAQKLIPGHGMTAAVRFRPISPSKVFGNDGFVIDLIQFPVVFLGIVDFQEKHPYHLLNSLCIAVDACVHPHSISYSLYKPGLHRHVILPQIHKYLFPAP